MTNITYSIPECINKAIRELEGMRFGPRDRDNAAHAANALTLLDALGVWAGQNVKPAEAEKNLSASAEASPLSGETETEVNTPDWDQIERECEA